MSPVVSESNPAREAAPRRRIWLLSGAVLWAVVAVASILLWKAERADRLAAEQHRKQEQRAAAPGDAPQIYKVPVTAASGDGSIQVNIADLLSQKPMTDDVPMWDPEGIADFTFTNCDGSTVTKADLMGRPWAVCFVFTHCLGPCPTVTRQMKQLQDRLKHFDLRLVTITVDPARDTPDVLLNYAKLNGADLSRWYFLSGDQTETYRLIQNSFRMPVQEVTGPNRQEGFEILHSTNVLLVDANGVVRHKFNAAKDEEMAALRREFQDLAARLPTGSDATPPIADAAR